MRKISIEGVIPDGPLYRFFPKDKYATDFINGEIRIGWLGKYLQMEGDIREDSSEGRAEYTADVPDLRTITIDTKTNREVGRSIKPGTMNISAFNLNEFYILCSSRIANDANLLQLRKRFAKDKKHLPKYVVINDVKRFTESILQSLEKSIYSDYVLSIRWFPVEYSKGKIRKNMEPEPYLEIYQKPKSSSDGKKDFTCENEFRLAIQMKHKSYISRLKNGPKRLFVQGEEYLERMSKYLDMTVEGLKQAPHIMKHYENVTTFWKENITLNNPEGFHGCSQLKE